MGPELSLLESLARLLLIVLLAAAVGAERELREQEAGLRTHMLVGLGAGLFVIAGNFAWTDLAFGSGRGVVLDPSRVVAYVVTGVGFLGAGTIIKNGGNVRGLTTAASLWVVAAIGVAVGSGLYLLGIFGTAVVLLSLWPVRQLAQELRLRSRRSTRVELELRPDARLADVIRGLESSGRGVTEIAVSGDPDARSVVVTLEDGRARIDAVEGVLHHRDVRRVTVA